ncbi:sigma-54-dependent transcriptional regulator [Pseudoalteromonas xiamenensis]
MKTVLLVDDDDQFVQIAARILEHLGCLCNISLSVEEAKALLQHQHYDHLFIDFMLPDGSGLHLVDWLRKQGNQVSVTLISGHPSVKTALDKLCVDGITHLLKPLVAEDFASILSPKKKPAITSKLKFGCLIGDSPAMNQLYDLIARVAKTNANVMLQGESGVGKEMVAQAIHNSSEVEGSYVGVNCGAIAKELIGSELFGHEKGAFTGAVAQKMGVFEQANKGTLFLDEVTEMPIDLQPNLLRVLETNSLTRVGGTSVIETNCRIISATNRTMEELASQNVIREDIYFRLAVFPITIPPLRDRKDDIPLLVAFFLDKFNQQGNTRYEVSEQDLKKLSLYDWPGNVRELKHCVHRAYILADQRTNKLVFDNAFSSPFSLYSSPRSEPSLNELSNNIVSPSSGATLHNVQAGKTIEEVEKALIFETLKSVDGNKTSAAKMLGISTKTLYNRLTSYQITE